MDTKVDYLDKSLLVDSLEKNLNYCIANIEFYKSKFKKLYNENTGLKSIEHFFQLPFTSKIDVQRGFPFGFLATDLTEIVAYHESSGTTGGTDKSSRSSSYYTKNDVDRDIERRNIPFLNFSSTDVVFNALPQAYTSSGASFSKLFASIGSCVITADTGSNYSSYRRQFELIMKLKPTILISSYPFIYSTLRHKLRVGEDAFSNIRAVVLCGMSASKQAMIKLSKEFNNAVVCNTYGMSEFGAIATGCSGGHTHVNDKSFFIEIVNPATTAHVAEGEPGEIVITTLDREGSPRFRYRTGDIGRMTHGTCDCGSTAPSIEVMGRLSQLIEFQGVRLLPSDIERILCEHESTTGIFNAVILEDGGMKITCDVVRQADKESLAQALKHSFDKRLKIRVDVECVNVGDTHKFLFAPSDKSAFKTILDFKNKLQSEDEWLVTY